MAAALTAVSACALTPEPRELLEQMHKAERANRVKAARFVYREEIVYTEGVEGAEPMRRSSSTYEVTILEGEPYHRRTGDRGGPLTAIEEALEEKRYREVEYYRRNTPLDERRRRFSAAEENRFKVDTGLVLEYHTARLLRQDALGGRLCWVIETEPRPHTPKPKRRSEWSQSQRIEFWIDAQTLFPALIVAHQLYDFDSSRKGTVTTIAHTLFEDAWLLSSIHSRGRRKAGRRTIILYETRQSYSNYRRFTSTSKLLFDDHE